MGIGKRGLVTVRMKFPHTTGESEIAQTIQPSIGCCLHFAKNRVSCTVGFDNAQVDADFNKTLVTRSTHLSETRKSEVLDRIFRTRKTNFVRHQLIRNMHNKA